VKLVSLILFLACFCIGVAYAQSPIQAASSDELVEKLTPNSSGMRTRGMRNLTPEEKAIEAIPSVDLSIQFEFDSAKLLPESKPLLNNLAKAINSDNLKSYTFLVEGHTDAVGSAEYNQRLSNQRALAVASYLSTLGVSRARLKTFGKGSNELLFPDKPDSAENRRVKIILNS
jgi:outer membrane protein OmpA-like peptidoglycan-associated protein